MVENIITKQFCEESNHYSAPEEKIRELVSKYGLPDDIIMDAIYCLPNFYYGDDMTTAEPIIKTVKLLLGFGANAKYTDKYGEDCLIESCFIWNAEIVQLLLEAGADPDYVWEFESTVDYFSFCEWFDDIPNELQSAAKKTVELLVQYSKKHQEYLAITAYIKSWNNLDVNIASDYLHERIEYRSKWVVETLSGKESVLKYLEGKFKTIKSSNSPVKMYLAVYNGSKCAVMFQLLDKPEMIGGRKVPYNSVTVLFDFEDNKIRSINVCAVPSFEEIELV